MKTTSLQEEKRSAVRHPFQQSIGVRHAGLNYHHAFNLSEMGMGFIYPESLEVGTDLLVTFFADSIIVKGTTRHCTRVDEHTHQIGLAFSQRERLLADTLLGFEM